MINTNSGIIQPILSVIVPVYNVEKYLVTCIESLVQQSNITEVEIILINDGSTDNSGRICDLYDQKYENVRVYHKVNGGLSDARNYGMRQAKGKYVLFVDSDDFLALGTIDRFIKEIKKNAVEVVLADAECVTEDGEIIEHPKYNYCHKGLIEENIYSGVGSIVAQLKNCGAYQTTVWLGVYSREFLLNNNFWFEKNLLHEDEMWTPKVLINAERVLYLKMKFYRYRIRENSIMRNKSTNLSKHVKDYIYIFSSMFKYIEWSVNDKTSRTLLKDNLVKKYLHTIVFWDFNSYPELYAMVDRKELLKNSLVAKNKFRAIMLMINRYLYIEIIKRISKWFV